MIFWYIFLFVLVFIFLIILIFGYPRKKSDRKSNMEGIDNPEVAKAFERMTKILPFRLLHRKIVSKLGEFDLSGRLVDLGCGIGNIILRIATKFPDLNLVGVDISSEILKRAKEYIKEKIPEKEIEFKIGNAEELPFPDNSVDFAISTFSLHHWLDPIKVFHEIYRILKKDGRFIIFDFRRDSRKFFYGFFTFVTKVIVPKSLKKVNEPFDSLQSGYTPNEIIQFLDQSPFNDIEISPFLAWMFIIGKK